jgi:NAD(P)-dependent dehydrogenase (short-subunit alcohol dehydrogenase family)
MGKACVEILSEHGFVVFAAVRKEADADTLRRSGSPRRIPVILDLTRPESLSAAFRTIEAEVGANGLFGLVNDAGIAVTGPLELLPIDELRRQFEVNVVGQIAVTQAALPLLRRARGRIVNVGSVGAKFALPFAGPLNASKGAFELLSDALRMELRPWGIHVVLVSPGATRTPAEAKFQKDAEATISRLSPEGQSRYAAPYRAFVRAFLQIESHGVGPEVMANTVLRAFTARVPKRHYPVGPRSRLFPAVLTTLPAGLADRVRLRLLHLQGRFGAAAASGSRQ